MKKVIVFNYFVNPKYNFIQNIVDWYGSMKQNYLVDCDRTFVIYTDNPEAKTSIKDSCIQIVDVDASTTSNIQENLRAKFRYIQDYLNTFHPEFDYLAFIQSNARCVEKVNLEELVSSNDLAVFRHCSSNKNFMCHYGENAGSVVQISPNEGKSFTYCHAGHFIAKHDVVDDMCRFICLSMEKDRENSIYTRWHDENYFNYYVNKIAIHGGRWKVNVLQGAVYCHADYSGVRSGYKVHLFDKNIKANAQNIMDKQDIFIKFIVPVFNGEKHIKRLLDSILQQTLQDFHIVCVDDCSTDGTLRILQEYKDRNPDKFTIIHNDVNMGQGPSINTGFTQTIDVVKSQFIWIVDADDVLYSNDVVLKMHQYCMENPDKDAVNIGWKWIKWNNQIEYRTANYEFPIARWGQIVRPTAYVPCLPYNMFACDIYPHFIMFDTMDDSKIGTLDFPCYIYKQAKIDRIPDAKELLIKEAIEKHTFKKPHVKDALYNGCAWDWIRRCQESQLVMTHHVGKITSEDLMKHSFVISIDDRRLDLFNKLFTAHGLSLPQKFQGIQECVDPVKNCYMSHRGVILKAKELGWPYVCVFEDDAYPCDGIKGKLDSYLNEIPEGWNLMVLGYANLLKKKALNDRWYKCVSSFGSHSYVVPNWAYDAFVAYLDSVRKGDCWSVRRDGIISNHSIICPVENLFIQYCEEKSFNGHSGYIFYGNEYGKNKVNPFENGFFPIEKYI